ncbi:MAG: hypothetical protein HYT40_03770 [Candidatus Sungbacteria bacterium]|uniref:Uncharacterized protein n=1 Tax=Candidatus Sungiibacteriota bacterium TaxID=2750080 RepID=A0A931SC81_9BACT|nr:hypothetical protein [Candidatus Sungbacteria bacterium]
MAVRSEILGGISLRFIDVMIGVILGLGFQWWPNFTELWQYIAFIFVYLDITDYWIDYSPSLRKFPPKREVDILIDMAIMFSIFLYIYSTQLTITYFLYSYILFNIFDIIWLGRAYLEYSPSNADSLFLKAWILFNGIEIIYTLGIVFLAMWGPTTALIAISIFIALRVITRILASLMYKRVYFF